MSFDTDRNAFASDVQEHDRFSAAAVIFVVMDLVNRDRSVRIEVTDSGNVRAAIFGRGTPHPQHTIHCSTEQLSEVIHLGGEGAFIHCPIEQINEIIRLGGDGAFPIVPLKYELSDGSFLIVSE